MWLEVGGQLETELAYTEKSLGYIDTSANNQLLIQTAKTNDAQAMLHGQALLNHLKIVKKAMSVEVFMGEATWTLKDLCQSPTIPRFDEHFIEQMVAQCKYFYEMFLGIQSVPPQSQLPVLSCPPPHHRHMILVTRYGNTIKFTE